MFKKLLIIGLLFAINGVFAQKTQQPNQVIEDLVEEIAQQHEGEFDFTQVTNDLYYFIDNPIELNSATDETLEQLRLLNDFQIKSLLNYRQKNGQLQTIYELQLVDGFDYTTIKKMLPFVSLSAINESQSWDINRALKYGNHTVFGRVASVLEIPDGYQKVSDSLKLVKPNNYYEGNRMRIYSRYAFNYKNKLLWGITADKDPGEQFFKADQRKGFDFYSMHAQVSDLGILKTAVLGDYQVQLGQGLIMWSYLSQGKSSYVMDVRKRGEGLKKYSSTDENQYFRGGGATLELAGLKLTAFASHKAIDANLATGDTLNNTYFTSFLISGIHALPSEKEDKDAVKETIYGGNLNWNYNKLKIGVSGVKYQFNIPYELTDNAVNKFKFRGKSNFNVSTDMEYKWQSMHLFGEAAVSKNGGKALLVGALMELSSRIRTSVLYRNYQKNYQALYANAFAEGSSIQNEAGFYLGVELYPVKKWKLSGYYDFYKFPWLKTGVDAPSKGSDYLIQADFITSRKVSMYWRLKVEEKELNAVPEDLGLSNLETNKKAILRYQLAYWVSDFWELRNRLELSYYSKESEASEKGYMLYQDVIYRPEKWPLAVTFRYAVFDTESFNTRIYSYEHDVLNAYSIPGFSDKGTRAYVLLNYKLTHQLSCWLRLAQTWYANKDVIGSGLNQINGHAQSEIKFQLRWKF